jgi:hypothetical protein
MSADLMDTKKFDLDALQREVELLLRLLKEREPGLFTWVGALHDRLRAIKAWSEGK